jgi:integrase
MIGSVTVLSGLLAKQKENFQQLGWEWDDSNYVFSNVDGTALHPDRVSESFARLISRSKLPHIRLHDLRHTMATLMLKNGEHPKIVSERLGHSTIGVTIDTYSHLVPGLQEGAASRLDDTIELPAEVVEKVTA